MQHIRSHLAVGALPNRFKNIVRADISGPMAFGLLGYWPFVSGGTPFRPHSAVIVPPKKKYAWKTEGVLTIDLSGTAGYRRNECLLFTVHVGMLIECLSSMLVILQLWGSFSAAWPSRATCCGGRYDNMPAEKSPNGLLATNSFNHSPILSTL